GAHSSLVRDGVPARPGVGGNDPDPAAVRRPKCLDRRPRPEPRPPGKPGRGLLPRRTWPRPTTIPEARLSAGASRPYPARAAAPMAAWLPLRSPFLPPDQVDHREDHHPHAVHEMPVPGDQFRAVLAGHLTLHRQPEDDNHDNHSDRDVESMEADQRVV